MQISFRDAVDFVPTVIRKQEPPTVAANDNWLEWPFISFPKGWYAAA